MAEMEMVPRRLEPRTLRLLAVRSNQLSYETSVTLQRNSIYNLFAWQIEEADRESPRHTPGQDRAGDLQRARLTS